MTNKNELIFINKILTAELPIRKAAKNLGLRRDDLIRRIKEILKNDEENIKKLDLIIFTNKIIFDNFKIKDVAKKLELSENELDKKIEIMLCKNKNKLKKYQKIKKLQNECC